MSNWKYTRTFILNKIKQGKQTKDGNYWCPEVTDIILIPGKVKDDCYYYPREMFKKKLYYSERDIEIFMSKENLDVEISDYFTISEMFYETNLDLVNNDLNIKLYKRDFTLSELIDCFEFKYTK